MFVERVKRLAKELAKELLASILKAIIVLMIVVGILMSVYEFIKWALPYIIVGGIIIWFIVHRFKKVRNK